MAEKQYTYGGLNGPYFYDDADGPAFWTEGQCEIEETPTQNNHVVRLIDLTVPPGTVGLSTTATVVTNSRLNLGALEVKTKLLTFTSGVLTTVGAESGWTATPL